MPRCAPCLDNPFKEELLAVLTDPDMRKAVAALPTCGGRKRSKYQIFVGECLRGKHLKGFDPTALKDCAQRWRERKGER